MFSAVAAAIGAATASLVIGINRREDPAGSMNFRQNIRQGKGKGRQQKSHNTAAMVKRAAVKRRNVQKRRAAA